MIEHTHIHIENSLQSIRLLQYEMQFHAFLAPWRLDNLPQRPARGWGLAQKDFWNSEQWPLYLFSSAFPSLIVCLNAFLEQDIWTSVWLGCPCSLDCRPTKTYIDDWSHPLHAHRITLLYVLVRCTRHGASQLSDVLLATATEPPQLPISKLMMTTQAQLRLDNLHHHHHPHHLYHPHQQHHHNRCRRRPHRHGHRHCHRHRHYHAPYHHCLYHHPHPHPNPQPHHCPHTYPHLLHCFLHNHCHRHGRGPWWSTSPSPGHHYCYKL